VVVAAAVKMGEGEREWHVTWPMAAHWQLLVVKVAGGCDPLCWSISVQFL
jgi:hypothetical protein